ncbi:MAG: hypothetical protein ACI8XD_001083, partial [Thermoproteota archaeon]
MFDSGWRVPKSGMGNEWYSNDDLRAMFESVKNWG